MGLPTPALSWWHNVSTTWHEPCQTIFECAYSVLAKLCLGKPHPFAREKKKGGTKYKGAVSFTGTVDTGNRAAVRVEAKPQFDTKPSIYERGE